MRRLNDGLDVVGISLRVDSFSAGVNVRAAGERVGLGPEFPRSIPDGVVEAREVLVRELLYSPFPYSAIYIILAFLFKS